MGSQTDERFILIGVDFIPIETLWVTGKDSLTVLTVDCILLLFSTGTAVLSLEPHCSQKLFEVGFLVLQFSHTFVSAIPNSLVG
jgi:hypothetical protein